MKYGDKCWGKKKKGGEEGWERKKRKRVEEEKYENKQTIYIYCSKTSKEMVAGAKGKGIFHKGKAIDRRRRRRRGNNLQVLGLPNWNMLRKE